MLRSLSIKNKLTIIIIGVSIVCLVLGFSYIYLHDLHEQKTALVYNTQMYAMLLGEYCITPMAFHDNEGALSILQKIDAVPYVLSCYLYSENGKLFAHHKPSLDHHKKFFSETDSTSFFKNNVLYVKKKLTYDGRNYGEIVVTASTAKIRVHSVQLILMLSVLMASLIFISYILASWLQRLISLPILRLAKISERISQSHNYDLTLVSPGNDEIGVLYSRFNEMLIQLQKRKSERDKALMRIQKSERRVRSILETSSEGFFQISAAYIIIAVNPAFCEIMQTTADKLLGKKVFDLVRDDEMVVLSHALTDIMAGKGASFEMTINFSEECHAHCLVNASPFYDEHGVLQGGFGLISDISERKHAEEALRESESRYRSLIETMSEGFTMHQSDGVLTYVNKRVCDMLHYSAEEMLGKSIQDFCDDNYVELVRDLPTLCMRDEDVSYEIELFTKEGDRVAVIISPQLVVDEGQAQGIFSVITDVTKLKNTEKELTQLKNNLEIEVKKKTDALIDTQKKLIQNERLAAMGQLGGTVAHEFRNQLGVMRNVAYYLKLKLQDKDEKILKHLKILEDEIVQTDKIIENILMFARAKEPDYKDVDVKMLINEAIEKNKARASKKVYFSVSFDENVSVIQADYIQMMQVFVNLIGNASESIKEEGSVTVNTQKKENFIEFLISDTGCGMTDEILKNIFEPLYTTKARGAGLGLPTVKILVERHGGSLNIESQVDVGTKVTVILPISRS